MTELATDAFRTVGPGNAIPNDFVVPYYLDDRKLRDLDRACRRSPLRVRRSLHLRRRGMPALRRPARRGRRSCANATAPASTSPPGAVINGPATEALNVYEVQEVEGSIRILA